MAFFNKLSRLFQVQHFNVSCKRLYVSYRTKVLNEFADTWKQKFSNILIEPNNVSKETWKSMRNIMIESNNNQNNVDALIFQLFRKEKCVDAGVNYYKFLEDNNYNLPMLASSEYLSLYRLKNTLTDAEKIHISNICKKIRDQCKLLPAFAAETVVISLCQIDEWEKAITVIKEFESHDSKVLKMAYSSLIEYLLKNGHSTLAYKYLVTGMEKGAQLSNRIYSTYLEYCLQERHTFNEKIEKLFLLWRKYGIKPTMNTVQKYIEVCNEVGWSAQLATISELQCDVCHETLEEIKLSDEEFKHIHEVVMKNVITNNAYRTSDPKELEAFKRFVTIHKPYDFVIDGLNLLGTSVDIKTEFRILLTRLKNGGKKVLVIGRSHFKKTAQKLGLMNLADFFFVNNLSNDDAFVLYATFSSGNGANIISKDLMRQHKFTFNNIELEVLFKRWQMMHQYCMPTDSDSLEKLHVITPIDSYVLKKNNCWHIPYHVNFTKHLTKLHMCDTNWACFNMRT